mmetsp:Transcript_34652/g.99565  ORF Transcript_34652/g.99565 Transcript_34652/m.99565 type:complete len:219 (+) Transcript_34652:117-773(+)
MEDTQADSSGRASLPGMPSSLSRVAAEKVYTERCNDEDKYLRHRLAHPPVAREPLGRHEGFDVVKLTSYTRVHKSTSSAPSATSTRSRRSGGGGSHLPSSDSRGGTPGPRPQIHASRSSSCGSRPASGPRSPVAAGGGIIAGGTQKAAKLSAAEDRLRELSEQCFIFPKYALTRYTMHHMQDLEKSPESCRSAGNLKRTISEPVVNATLLGLPPRTPC